MTEKIYVPKSSAEKKEFANGGSILRLGFHAATLIDFIKQHANGAGYINFTVGERRQASERGSTHWVALDTWQPKAGSTPAPKPSTSQPSGPEPKDDSDSSVPF